MKTILLTIVIFRLILAKSETTEAATSASIDNIGPPVLKDGAVVAGSQPGEPVSSPILDMLNKEVPKSTPPANIYKIVAYAARRLLFAGYINTGVRGIFGARLTKSLLGDQKQTILPYITSNCENSMYLKTLAHISKRRRMDDVHFIIIIVT
eukprot:GHVU01041845.1.p1 GENE.GHVU01041845.1~~GHVU01041845.1.p1  ORF type:complete len:152 (+),score=6.46 GHVU01041845.1:120-575(+)